MDFGSKWQSQKEILRSAGITGEMTTKDEITDFLKKSGSFTPTENSTAWAEAANAIKINVQNKDINLPNVNWQGNTIINLKGDWQAIANSIKTHFWSDENIIRAESTIGSELARIWLKPEEIEEIKRLLWISN